MICQKFLAIAYREAGFAHIVERGVQGVDVDAANGSYERYSIELKTTTKDSVQLKQKDIDGLMSRQADGYLTLLGVLRLGTLSDWWLAMATELRAGCLCVDRLRPYRRKDLEEFINPFLDGVIEQHFEGAFTGSQAYLDGVLQQKGIEIIRL
jgi:hypothetical protein